LFALEQGCYNSLFYHSQGYRDEAKKEQIEYQSEYRKLGGG
jgi:hypothetical protein